MRAKTKSKGRSAATKLKSSRTGKAKSRSKKKAVSTRRAGAKRRGTATVAKAQKRSTAAPSGNKIVRIMGHGQFTVENRTLKKLNEIDNSIVQLVGAERSDDTEFKNRLTELSKMVVENGKPLDPHEIIKSDIILPSADLSIDEAKKLFRGEGVIPEI